MSKKARAFETGSDYPWRDAPPGRSLPWPKNAEWFSLGRGAVYAIWRQESRRGARRMVLPSYFCGEVVEWLRGSGVRLAFYTDDPTRSEPDWKTLRPRRRDIVIAVNYFGVRTGSCWATWHSGHPEVILAEDHTHDPFSRWAAESRADYAFASVRKLLPVADGALLWSNTGHAVPRPGPPPAFAAADVKLAGMVLKHHYLSGDHPTRELKEAARALLVLGERELSARRQAPASTWSRTILAAGYPAALRAKRTNNVRCFLDELPPMRGVRPLFRSWPAGSSPLNPVLLCRNGPLREVLRTRLCAQGVYMPVHWELDGTAGAAEKGISERIMTVPLDHRCEPAEATQIARMLAATTEVGGRR